MSGSLLKAATTVLLLGGLWFVRAQEPGASPFLPPCPFHELTDLHCPGCGSTRALHALLNGHLGEALGHNVLTVAALPFLSFWYLLWLTPHRWFAGFRDKRLPGWSLWAGLILIIFFTMLRNLPWWPFTLLAP